METPKEKANILFYQMLELNDETTSTEIMVEFAKLETKHLEQQIEKLEADKAELLQALEIFFPMFTELDSEFGIENPHPRKWTEMEIATVQKLFDLIQKMKNENISRRH